MSLFMKIISRNIEDKIIIDTLIYLSCFGTFSLYSNYIKSFVNNENFQETIQKKNENCQEKIRKKIFYFFYIFSPLIKF